MNTLHAQGLAAGWTLQDLHPDVDAVLVYVDERFLVFARPDQHLRATATYRNEKNRFGETTRPGDPTFRAGTVLTRRRESVEAIRAANEWLAMHEAELRRTAPANDNGGST